MVLDLVRPESIKRLLSREPPEAMMGVSLRSELSLINSLTVTADAKSLSFKGSVVLLLALGFRVALALEAELEGLLKWLTFFTCCL